MTERKKILLVEDDDATRVGLSTLLERAGYDVVATESVQEGRSALEDASPDLLITDVRLGAFNGLQLIAMSPRPIPPSSRRDFPIPCWRPRPGNSARSSSSSQSSRQAC